MSSRTAVPSASAIPSPSFWDKFILPMLLSGFLGFVGLGWKLYDTLSNFNVQMEVFATNQQALREADKEYAANQAKILEFVHQLDRRLLSMEVREEMENKE